MKYAPLSFFRLQWTLGFKGPASRHCVLSWLLLGASHKATDIGTGKSRFSLILQSVPQSLAMCNRSSFYLSLSREQLYAAIHCGRLCTCTSCPFAKTQIIFLVYIYYVVNFDLSIPYYNFFR